MRRLLQIDDLAHGKPPNRTAAGHRQIRACLRREPLERLAERGVKLLGLHGFQQEVHVRRLVDRRRVFHIARHVDHLSATALGKQPRDRLDAVGEAPRVVIHAHVHEADVHRTVMDLEAFEIGHALKGANIKGRERRIGDHVRQNSALAKVVIDNGHCVHASSFLAFRLPNAQTAPLRAAAIASCYYLKRGAPLHRPMSFSVGMLSQNASRIGERHATRPSRMPPFATGPTVRSRAPRPFCRRSPVLQPPATYRQRTTMLATH